MAKTEAILFNMSIFVLGYIILLFKGKLSYNEELILMVVYMLLFSIFVLSSKNAVKNFIIQHIFNLMYFYEKNFYVKIKILLLSIVIFNSLNKKELVKNSKCLIDLYIKHQMKTYVHNIKKYYNPLFLYSILFMLNI